jgi:rubredoxin
MKLELIFIGIIGFLIYNAYHGWIYTKMIMSWKKYFQTAFYLFIAFCLYLMIKKNPDRTKSLLFQTNNLIKAIPIDRTSMNMISPIFDFTDTQSGGFMQEGGRTHIMGFNPDDNNQTKVKRSVSETKKKYVASNQNWICNDCKNKLTHTFEIDHVISLKMGGTNDVSNLVALCPSCHRNKTAFENF